MKKGFLFFFILIVCGYTSKSAYLYNHNSLNFLIDSIPAKNKNGIKKIIKITAPFQGKRTFCSAESDTKYSVTIKGNNVLIIVDNKKITGVYKKDKLFTNDAGEIEYRKFAPKNNYGKFYVIATDFFSVLNAENSEYSYFTVCK